MIQHIVFFDLKSELNETERAEFERDLRALAGIPVVRRLEIGRPAPMPKRAVSDTDFTVALYTWFESVSDHDYYQIHPLHRDFLERNRHRWSRVRVFDSVLSVGEAASSAARGGLHHVALHSAEFDRSIAFYRDVLKLEVRRIWHMNSGRAAMLEAGDGGIVEIFERKAGTSEIETGPLVHFALTVRSVDETTAAVRAAGLAVMVEPKSVTIVDAEGRGSYPVRVAFFKGPGGEMVELFEECH